MDFAEPEGVEALRKEIAEFLADALPQHLVDEVYRSGVSHDDDFVRALAERGWLGSDPEGGGELDPFHHYVLLDQLTKVEAPTYAAETTAMVANVIRHVGSEWLRAEVLPGVARGETTIALGMTEPEAGSDVAAVQTRARRDGDAWRIDGSKMFTTNGHVTDYVFLLARTDPEVPKHEGLTTFLVPLDLPGVEVQAVFTLSGERTNITYYDGVLLEDRWRIGDVDQGWAALMVALQDEHSAPFSAHLAPLLEAAERWARTESAEGTRPLDDVETREVLARAAADLRVAQLLEWRTA